MYYLLLIIFLPTGNTAVIVPAPFKAVEDCNAMGKANMAGLVAREPGEVVGFNCVLDPK